ncbi:MAG: Dna2/Cas4 domain-containing protein [Clostridia bacterium]|nr:Dna2/Cas4 domain-containing protein [Clostridia bacterium]
MEQRIIEGLEFEERTHTYRLDGFELPSVTTIMKPLSQANYKGISEFTLNQAADKGTIVHGSIEEFILYGMIDVPEEYKGYLDAFMDWYELRKPTPLIIEHQTCHKIFRYAGTVDNVSEINGVKTLIDYKTTYNTSSNTWGIQLEAYAKCLEQEGINIGRKMVLHLAKTGKWKEIEYPVPDAESWRVFTSLKCIYDYMQK